MAEALLKVVLGNLNTFVQRELATFRGVDGEIESLSSNISAIRAVLADAEIQQITKHSLKDWIRKLTDAAYVLDDILDECSIRAEISGSSLSHPQNVLFRFKIGKKLKEISERLDKIAKERHDYGLHEGITPRRAEVAEWRQTMSPVPDHEVYGREEDREKIVEFLVEHARHCDDLSIYPIVGTGGVGKTTLAQLVFNDERVRHSFDFTIWVCVSDEFSIRKIMRSIIDFASRQKYKSLQLDESNKIIQKKIASKKSFKAPPEQNCNISNLDLLQNLLHNDSSNLELLQSQVRDLLHNRKYLLVLDDVWDKIETEWERLKCVLQCGAKGSSVLVTTRLANTASIMGTVPLPYELSTLSEDDCWLLVKQRALGLDGEEGVKHLEAIGRQIVRKCGRLPLAAKALGSALRSKTTEAEWLSIRDSELWNLSGDHYILPALQLSYSNLDLQLRRCFAFCAIFPKDHEILKEHVIHLWMANGFISSHKHSDVEDVGDAMWYELYQKSFFQDVKLDKWGNERSFKMHDLIHDLAQSVIKNECVVINPKSFTGLPVNIHHIACLNSDQPFNMGMVKKVESLRTFFQLGLDFNITSFKFPRFRSLRAMRVRLLQLPSLEYLIHLRYLDLNCRSISSLPESICNLRKLETLKLSYCYDLRHLPHQLTQLHYLRHLVVEHYLSLLALPPNIGKLSCLKTLNVFIVGSEKGHRIAELRDLQLREKLHIGGLTNVRSQSEAKEANLIGKKDLNHLYLSWDFTFDSQATEIAQVLEGLQPHPNLKSLGIEGYEGGRLPSWMTDISFLPFLTALVLYDCQNCQQLPTLGKLTCLKWLCIYGLLHVQHIDDGNYDYADKAFPSLEKLTLKLLPNLERMVKDEAVEIFPCLSQLIISDVPKLILPSIPSVEHLDVDGCNSNAVLMSISNYCKLKFLRLCDNDELISLPEKISRNLNHLKTLHIRGFRKLEALSDEHISLHELEELDISECYQLESLSFQGLSSLRTLKIYYCWKLRSFTKGNGHLTSLEKLDIWQCGELEALANDTNQLTALRELRIGGGGILRMKIPIGLERIPSLQSLYLMAFPGLTWLPDCLGDMTSLRELTITSCPELRSLPSGFQHLTNLEKLVIERCPELEKRCKRGRGEEWHKIQHIPQIQLGGDSESGTRTVSDNIRIAWKKGRRLIHNLVSHSDEPRYYPFQLGGDSESGTRTVSDNIRIAWKKGRRLIHNLVSHSDDPHYPNCCPFSPSFYWIIDELS